jgi:hypothetical protein
MSALWFWQWVEEPDPFDPTAWKRKPPCRIYAADGIRYALVDEEFYSQLVTMRATRYGETRPRRWNPKPLHPKRNGRKLYFVSNAGWRNGGAVFLHVAVMRLSGILPPSKKHKLVNHIDGKEWNCQLYNLEWATHVKNRHTANGVNRLNKGPHHDEEEAVGCSTDPIIDEGETPPEVKTGGT